jgi:hypothetical protein
MREVNFSIPNVNKASVGITTALYDRRALDCTSTLPLINSLNHLAYLTTSSARIRDILTVDGGIERLVSILKQGRSKDPMGTWKWNLAFQCVVNIGVRGTENVRTRVVEADMVPVIATILDNYIKVIEKCREKADEAKHKHVSDHHRHRPHKASSSSRATSAAAAINDDSAASSSRRQPASLEVNTTAAPGPSTLSTHRASNPPHNINNTLLAQAGRDINGILSIHRRHGSGTEGRSGSSSNSSSRETITPLAAATAAAATTAVSTAENITTVGRPVQRPDPLVPLNHSDLVSQPTSPTTPLAPPQSRSPTIRPVSNLTPSARPRRRPSIRHQNSTTESEDINAESVASDENPDTDMADNGGLQPAVGIQDITMEDGESMLAGASLDLTTPTVSETHQDGDTFNITHRTSIDGSVNTGAQTPVPQMGLSPNRPAMVTPTQPQMPTTTVPRYLLDRHFQPSPELVAVMPREEDVLMSLQLLAYVSKYCGLRSNFQQSHLVPKLKIDRELAASESDVERDLKAEEAEDEEAEDTEYLLPNDFNLFPLVEKFTVRYHTTDMQYWAGVVMRNLCRKDDTRGGIRQCAYYQCGKWEEYTRQFAKCRRCRRTKYCSKECQKSAWAFHRHWCVAVSQ